MSPSPETAGGSGGQHAHSTDPDRSIIAKVVWGRWQHSAPPSRGDLALFRQAMREGWDVPTVTRKQVIDTIMTTLESLSVRLGLSAINTLLAADRANLKARAASRNS